MNKATTHESAVPATVEIDGYTFPRFDLVRLLSTVFELNEGENIGVFTDLPEPREVIDFRYLDDDAYGPQKHAFETLYKGLEKNREKLKLSGVAFYAYEETGGSNLDLPDTVVTPQGETLQLRDALQRHTIVLYMGRWSATAPLTALAKELGLRGATMHGTNERVLASGLAVDYEEVSARAERMREAMSGADSMLLEWSVMGEPVQLELELGGQDAQKSHGLVRTLGDVANLPAGEVYYVPTGGRGQLPQQFEDPQQTIAIFKVEDRGIVGLEKLVRGDAQLVRDYLEVIDFDRNAGQLTELGLGTQQLPWAHTDIQDEKILGTAHVATGRSDHLGGDISSENFKNKRNATHNDILFTPEKTPDVALERVTMRRNGEETVIVEGYQPSAFLTPLL